MSLENGWYTDNRRGTFDSRTDSRNSRRVRFDLSHSQASHRHGIPFELRGRNIIASTRSACLHSFENDISSWYCLLLDQDTVVLLEEALELLRNSHQEDCVSRVTDLVGNLTREKKINIVLVNSKYLKRPLSTGLLRPSEVLSHFLIQAALRIIVVVHKANNSYDELAIPPENPPGSAREVTRTRLLSNRTFKNALSKPLEDLVLKLWYEMTRGKRHLNDYPMGFQAHHVARDSLLIPIGEHELLDHTVQKPAASYRRFQREVSDALNDLQIPFWFEKTPIDVLLLLVLAGDSTLAIRSLTEVRTFRRLRKRRKTPGLIHRLIELFFHAIIVRNLQQVQYSPDGAKLRLRWYCKVLAWLYVGLSLFAGFMTATQNLGNRDNAFERIMDSISVVSLLLISVFGLLKLTSSDQNVVRNTIKGYRIARNPRVLLYSLGFDTESGLKAKLAVLGTEVPWLQYYRTALLDESKCTGVLRLQDRTKLDDIVHAEGFVAGGRMVLMPQKMAGHRKGDRWFMFDELQELNVIRCRQAGAGSIVSSVVPVDV